MAQLGTPATESSPGDSGQRAVRGSRLARRRRALFWVAGGAALLAIGGLIGASFVKSPQQIAADTAAPPLTVTTAKVVSQVLTSSVQMRGVVYPATQYDVYPSAPESDTTTGDTGSSAAGSAGTGGSSASVYISRLDVAAGKTVTNGEKLAEIDGEPLFALAGRVPAWRDITPGESGPDVAELQKALASLGYYTGGDAQGFFGTATQDAVALYYGRLGYTPPASGGVPMPDVIFLPSLPAKVIAVNGARGQQPGQPFLELAARGSLALTGELPPAYAAQVKPGLKAKIFDEVTGVHATGTVADVGTATTIAPVGAIVNVGGGAAAASAAESTGSGAASAGSAGTGSAGTSNSGSAANPGAAPFIPLAVQPSKSLPAALNGENVLVTVETGQTEGPALTVETLNNYIGSDVINDGELHAAMQRWSACMAKQGFHSSDADSFAQQVQENLGQRPAPGQNITSPGQPTAAQNRAQIAEAVADANCTLSSDLSGVYFAVQASYEKQFVSANQQALNAGIREYKAAFAKTLKTMPTLLQTTSAIPNLPGPPPTGHHGKHGAAKPSPSHS